MAGHEDLDPRREQQLSDKADFEHECLFEQAKALLEFDTELMRFKEFIDRNIEKYDEIVDEILKEFPQHMIDELKYNQGKEDEC